MSAYEYLGIGVVVFSTALTIISVLYLAVIGLRSVLKQPEAEPADTRLKALERLGMR